MRRRPAPGRRASLCRFPASCNCDWNRVAGMGMEGLLADFEARGLVHDCTDFDGLARRLAEGPVTVYHGIDPTADSLHVGHLVGVLALRRFQLAGHRAVALAGGATGMVGDPSGRSAERNLLDTDALAANV